MQDYKLVLRAITAGATQLSDTGAVTVQNASEFMSYLNEQYLRNGYVISSITLLRPVDAGANVYEFAYHLVKEVDSKGK